jgi:hypothetical protein
LLGDIFFWVKDRCDQRPVVIRPILARAGFSSHGVSTQPGRAARSHLAPRILHPMRCRRSPTWDQCATSGVLSHGRCAVVFTRPCTFSIANHALWKYTGWCTKGGDSPAHGQASSRPRTRSTLSSSSSTTPLCSATTRLATPTRRTRRAPRGFVPAGRDSCRP